MMRTLIASVFLFALTAPFHGRFVEISNDYIKIGADSATARFTAETVAGDPGISQDDRKSILYAKTPLTSFTTLSIDGETVIFGSDRGNFIKRPYIDGKKIVTGWEYSGILVAQELTLTRGVSTGLEDTFLITYKMSNKSGRKRKIGVRILLDVLLGGVKPRSFGTPGQGTIDRETQFVLDKVPATWSAFDDNANPVVRVQGSLSGSGNTRPSRIVFAAWDKFYDHPWDFPLDGNRDFRRLATPEYDSAVALYYDPMELDSDQNMIVSTSLGMFGAGFFTDKDMLLSLSVPNDPGQPPVPVSAQFANQSQNVLDGLLLELTVPRGFTLPAGETNIVNFVKINPSDTKTALWNLTSGTIGGTFKVIVKATAVQGAVSNDIVSEQSFRINYKENMGVPTNAVAELPKPKPPVAEPAPVIVPVTPVAVTNVFNVTNQMVLVEETPQETSPEEKQLALEIRELDRLIGEINKKYQVLMGIYQNVYRPNETFLSGIDADIRGYESDLRNQESILSNQKKLLGKALD